jgi:WD40 repeat protein
MPSLQLVKIFQSSWQRYRVWIIIAIATSLGGWTGWQWMQSQQESRNSANNLSNSAIPLPSNLPLSLRPSGATGENRPIPSPIPQMAAPKFQIEQTFSGVGNSINALAISSDNTNLISVSDYSKAVTWDLSQICQGGECQTPKKVLPMYSLWVYDVAINSSSNLAVGGSWNVVKVWDLVNGNIVRNIQVHFGSVYKVLLGAKTDNLVTASSDQTVKIWDLDTGKLKQTLTGHNAPVQALAMSTDEKLLASGATNGGIKVWNLEQNCFPESCKESLLTLSGHEKQVNALGISSDNQYLVSGGADQTVKIWNLQTGELIHDITAHEGSVLAIALSPDGKFFASASTDQTIKLWEVSTGAFLGNLSSHSDAVHSLAFSKDGTLLVSGGNDRRINVWRRES